MCAISQACIELCDPDTSKAQAACRDLLSILASRDFSFEHVLAPVVFRLAERPPQWRVLEDVCSLAQMLLTRAGPDVLPENKAANVFPLLCERIGSLLEIVLSGGRSGGVEVVTVDLLKLLKILMEKWLDAARGTEVCKMQTGFIAHLAVSFLSVEVSREEHLLSAEVLQTLAEVEPVDSLASFYPGVCTALAKVLLGRAHGKGSKVVVACCRCFSAWLQAVLANEVNHLGTVQVSKNSGLEDLVQIFSRSVSLDQSKPSNGEASQLPGLSNLNRDEIWLEETGTRTSQVLIAVLRGEHSTGTLWSEKASVRQALLDLSISAVRKCNKTLKQEALEACLEIVFASLCDEPVKMVAHAFLQESLENHSFQLVQSRLEDWLIKLFQELAPDARNLDGAFVPKRLARLDGLLQFLETVSSNFIWTDSCIQRLRGPILRACSMNADVIRQLQDQRSLAAMPGTTKSQAEKFVQLFPYDAREARDHSAGIVDVSAPHLDNLELGDPAEHVTSYLPKDVVQVKMWLLRASRVANGNEDLAKSVRLMLARLARVIGAETLFTGIFEESCSWKQSAVKDWDGADGAEANLSDSDLERRTAGMFALAACLDGAETRDFPVWLVKHCLSIALSAREAGMPPAIATNELVLLVCTPRAFPFFLKLV